jgi:chorismate-pyruvate lyase
MKFRMKSIYPNKSSDEQKNGSLRVNNDYDPLGDLFVAQSEKPDYLEAINLRALSPFLRALLTIDGTVTKYIEAYTMEPVVVLRLSQESRPLPANHPWLNAAHGEIAVAREVILRGKYTRRLYVYATSLIIPERLPLDSRKELDIQGGSLGRILLSSRMETYREILWYGREHLSRLPEEIEEYADTDFISRTYRIFANKVPIMLINEKFPTAGDWEIAHE